MGIGTRVTFNLHGVKCYGVIEAKFEGKCWVVAPNGKGLLINAGKLTRWQPEGN